MDRAGADACPPADREALLLDTAELLRHSETNTPTTDAAQDRLQSLWKRAG